MREGFLMRLQREKEGGELRTQAGWSGRKKEGTSYTWAVPVGPHQERAAGRLLSFLFVILYEHCTKPNLSKLVSTLRRFAFEVNCVGFVELLGSDLIDFQVCVSVHM